jgi:hypothetical protein
MELNPPQAQANLPQKQSARADITSLTLAFDILHAEVELEVEGDSRTAIAFCVRALLAARSITTRLPPAEASTVITSKTN